VKLAEQNSELFAATAPEGNSGIAAGN